MNVPEGFILTAGPGWLAVNKPAGLSVHNDPSGDALSLAKYCLEQDEELGRVTSFDSLSPAHRLDKETSGVLIFATTRASASLLQQTFAEADTRAKKIYRAVVKGAIESEGRWTSPITDKAEGRENPAGKSAERKPSDTRFRVVKSNTYLTELEIDLATGRQHQIRKHAALAKHPVVGDRRYGDPKHAKMIEMKLGVGRMLLHALSLELTAGSLRIEAEAPRPREFDRVFASPDDRGTK
ncbi:MAG: RNA pseudouridine synthase [Bdellovibrionota bacterium]